MDIDLGEISPGGATATCDAHNGVSGGTPRYTFPVDVHPLYDTVSVDATTGLVGSTASEDAEPGHVDFSIGVSDSAATPACDQLFFHVTITDGSDDGIPRPMEGVTPEPTGTVTPAETPTTTHTQHDGKDHDPDAAVTTQPATGHDPDAAGPVTGLLAVAVLLGAMAVLSTWFAREPANR